MSSPSINTGTSSLDVLILAAGLGTRMKSNVAKVLHKLDGRPLIAHVARTAAALQPRKTYVVIGHQSDQVQSAVQNELGPKATEFVRQIKQRGTGDAVLAASEALASGSPTVLILSGDVPLIRAETLEKLLATHQSENAACTILTVRMENPIGYGRIVRDEANAFCKIVEQRDASAEEQKI